MLLLRPPSVSNPAVKFDFSRFSSLRSCLFPALGVKNGYLANIFHTTLIPKSVPTKNSSRRVLSLFICHFGHCHSATCHSATLPFSSQPKTAKTFSSPAPFCARAQHEHNTSFDPVPLVCQLATFSLFPLLPSTLLNHRLGARFTLPASTSRPASSPPSRPVRTTPPPPSPPTQQPT